jgi:ABC-type transport system involved in multi-copper enzyme maturation permease subunit
MRAELLKVRSMPTPRWCLIIVGICALLGLAAVWEWGLGTELVAFDLAIGFPLAVASIAFGAWIFGVEYGQNTLRRTLTADPRRLRLFFSKFVVAMLLVALVTVVVHLIAFPFYDIAADRHDQGIAVAELRDVVLASLVSNLVYVIVGGALVLITGSMAGGVTAALVFIFVIDSVLAVVPEVGDFSLGVALADILLTIRPAQDLLGSTVHSTSVAVAILVGWLVVLAGFGWLRLWRSDVK